MSISNSLTAITVNNTNIRSLNNTVEGATYKNLTRILDLKSEVNILIDTRTNLDGVNKIFNCNKLKWRLGHFRHQGTYTPAKVIVMIYDKNRVQVKDLKIIQNGQLISFRVKINTNWINFVSVYGPPEGDNPDFFLTTKLP